PVVTLTFVFRFPLTDAPPTVPTWSAVTESLFPEITIEFASLELLKKPQPVKVMLRLLAVVDRTVPVVPVASTQSPPPRTTATALPQMWALPDISIAENSRPRDCFTTTSVAPDAPMYRELGKQVPCGGLLTVTVTPSVPSTR